MAKHAIVHIEFSARDLKKTAKFYGDLFNWKLQEMPDSSYITFECLTP